MDSKIIGARGGVEWICTTILVLSLTVCMLVPIVPGPLPLHKLGCSYHVAVFSDFIRNSSELMVAISLPPHPLGELPPERMQTTAPTTERAVHLGPGRMG